MSLGCLLFLQFLISRVCFQRSWYSICKLYKFHFCCNCLRKIWICDHKWPITRWFWDIMKWGFKLLLRLYIRCTPFFWSFLQVASFSINLANKLISDRLLFCLRSYGHFKIWYHEIPPLRLYFPTTSWAITFNLEL